MRKAYELALSDHGVQHKEELKKIFLCIDDIVAGKDYNEQRQNLLDVLEVLSSSSPNALINGVGESYDTEVLRDYINDSFLEMVNALKELSNIRISGRPRLSKYINLVIECMACARCNDVLSLNCDNVTLNNVRYVENVMASVLPRDKEYPKSHGITLVPGATIQNLKLIVYKTDPVVFTPGKMWINKPAQEVRVSMANKDGDIEVHRIVTEAI